MIRPSAPLAALARSAALALILAFAAPRPAWTQADDVERSEFPIEVRNADLARRFKPHAAARAAVSTAPDSVWIGYNPAYAGSNYWSVGVGPNRPGEQVGGNWDWEHPVHGDSLMGWWPVHLLYFSSGGLTIPDSQRPWWAVDEGNMANYVLSQGPGFKRTFGVTGVWHRDIGNTGAGAGKGVGWTPLSGTASAWCGLRRAGDATHLDPRTGNPFDGDMMSPTSFGAQPNLPAVGTAKKFPGYGSQWDQMLYRDVDLSAVPLSDLNVNFKLRTRMSTAYTTNTASRTGWFDKDPLTMASGNFISSSTAGTSAPIDSFMVYVGAPVDSFFVATNTQTARVFDPERRWFDEVIRVNEPAVPYREIYTTYGDRDLNLSLNLPNAQLAPILAATGGRVRLVFRSKTNRGFDDEGGSQSSTAYNSGGQGAVIVDDVEVNSLMIGNFESASTIDNDPAVPALTAWKSTGKPPGTYFHVHELASLVFEDICGPPSSPTRVCNMQGHVISMGDHDRSESAGGPMGTALQERRDAIVSPTICLKTSGSGPNAWGVTQEMIDERQDFYISYDIYTGYFDLFSQGNQWLVMAQSWPCLQSDGTQVWGDYRTAGTTVFNPAKECFTEGSFGLYGNGMIRTSNASGVPDSIRIGVWKQQECYRFAITTGCGSTDGGYLDNLSFLILRSQPAVAVSFVQPADWFQDTFSANETAGLPLTSSFDTTAALVRMGRNITSTSYVTYRYDVPGDSIPISVELPNPRVDLVFRIKPGPGNYVSPGNVASGLRRVPTSPTPVTTPGDGDLSFWSQYITENGIYGTPGGHGSSWDPNVWNSARCDSAPNVGMFWPIVNRSIGVPVNFGVLYFATVYHEEDPKFTSLGIKKNLCFLVNPSGAANNTNITCSSVPAWATTAGYVPEYPGQPGVTIRNTKILPDGQFTPGTHVEYFLRISDAATGEATVQLLPDTNLVVPQTNEYSSDGHRWQQFAVLPDLWKRSEYGGLGLACMLVVDGADRLGEETAWVSIADTIGATHSSRYGAHNGWHARGDVSPNDPSSFVAEHGGQPGTTWDLYNVKGGESSISPAGGIGSRLAYRTSDPSNLYYGKDSRQGPTIEMLEHFYKIVLYLAGPVGSPLAPSTLRPADDVGMLYAFLLDATAGNPRGLVFLGSQFAYGFAGGTSQSAFMQDGLKTDLVAQRYSTRAQYFEPSAEVKTTAALTASGSIYGMDNDCANPHAVIAPRSGGVTAALFSPTGAAPDPPGAAVLHPLNSGAFENWISVAASFRAQDLVERYGSSTAGRRLFFLALFNEIFASLCNLAPYGTTDVPNGDLEPLVEFMRLTNNPMLRGDVGVEFGLAHPDRVEAKVYDVSGRVVRTLADRRFTPGIQRLVWDGTDDRGVPLARGVYFARMRFAGSGFTSARKVIVLR